MGKLILRNNGLETQLINGQDFSTITPESGVYFIGVNAANGVFEKLNPSGDIIDFEAGGGETFTGGTVTGSTDFTGGLTADVISATTYLNLPVTQFTGGTVPGETTFENGVIADVITVQTISATTYLNIAAGGGIIETTYSELTSLISTSGLTKGSYYLITDFRTCYDQPDFDNETNAILTGNYKVADIEPLLVFALSTSEISDSALSPLFPKDKIKYDYTFNQTEVTSGASYGRITERIDDSGNRTDYDHRNILFKRYNSYILDYSLNGRIISVNGTSVTGYLTNFVSDLNVGDIVFIPTPASFGNGFYTVTNIISNTSIEVSGRTYYNYTSNSDEGVRIWKAILDYDNKLGTIYYFNDSGSNIINDGGNDMYDNGNSLNTDQYGTIPYTHTQMTGVSNEASIGDFTMDGTVQSGVGKFGASSSYFTNYYPGLFVMVADSTDVSYFETSGDLGADGSGSFNTYTYNTTVGGNDYTAYIKVVGDGGFDPSVNHIIIVNTDGTGLNHVVGSTTNDDLDRVENLNSNGVTQIHYLLTGLAKGVKLTYAQFSCMVDSYLTLIDGNDINTILSTLNLSYSDVTSCLPARQVISASFDFKQSNVFENTGYTEVLTFENTKATNTYIGDFARYRDDYGFDFILSNNVFGSIFNSSEAINNTIGDFSYNNTFGYNFNNNRFVGPVQKNTCYNSVFNNTTMSFFRNNAIFNNLNDNEIGTYFVDNIILDDFYRNDIGNDFEGNVISSNFQNNEIGNSFNNNVITNNFYKNDVGNGFNNNKIYASVYGNLIGNAFNDNKIYDQCHDNVIGEYFELNTILGDFYANRILNSFNSNITDAQFYNNNISNNFENNAILTYFYSNNISNYFRNNNIGDYFNSNDIKDYFQHNTIADYFEFNKIGSFFGNGGSGLIQNTILNNFSHNIIGDYFGNDYNYPTIGSGTNNDGGNTINENFQYNTIGDNAIFNIVDSGFRYNKVGEYLMFNSFNTTNEDNVIGNLFVGNSGTGGFPNQMDGLFTSNKIGNYFSYNTINASLLSNEIGDFFGNTNSSDNNKIYGEIRFNKIGNFFGYESSSSGGNTVYSEFYDNLIGNKFYSNYIGDNSGYNDFYRNDIGNDFRDNIVHGEFQNNEIGNQYNNNIIGNSFIKNVIGHGFNNNSTFNFESNKIGDGFNGNVINHDFNNNIINEYFSSNFINTSYNNIIGNNFSNNSFGTGYGYYDVSDVTSRNYSVFRVALSYNVGNYIVGRQLIMHDTVNNEYYKIKFTKWTQGGAGGGFAYQRQLVYPSFGPVITFERPDYEPSTIDVIVPGVIEIKRDDANAAIYNSAVEGSYNSGVSPANTEWNSVFNALNYGNDFKENIISNNFQGNNKIGLGFSYNRINRTFNNNQNIGNYFRKNNIDCEVGSIDFTSSTFVYGNYNCNIFENSNSAVRLSYYDGSDVLNITNITA